MGGRKPEYPNGEKKPKSAVKAGTDRTAELAKLREMARQPVKRGLISRGKGRGRG